MKLLVPATIMALICGIVVFAFRRPRNTSLELNEDISGSSSDEPEIYASEISYSVNGITCLGYIAYHLESENRRPVILIIPEWWGITWFTKLRARILAKQGYVAFVADMYGNGTIAANPEEARSLSEPFYKNPQLARDNMLAALAVARTIPAANVYKTAVIGYCFGGSMALNFASMGEPVNGVVSFHSGLKIVPPQNGITASILVCHGDNDIFVSNQTIELFKQQMLDAGANFSFIIYPNATHSFTNPQSDEYCRKFNIPIAYNEVADKASWGDMHTFFNSIFQ